MYLGRTVGVGKTKDGRNFIAYAVSGRSPTSKERKARIMEDAGVRRVNIGPLDPNNLSLDQKEQAQWIYYDGLIIPKDTINDNVSAIASNGEQTTAIYNLLLDDVLDLNGRHAARAAMKVLGPEREKYKTPRIAGLLFSPTIEDFGYLSIITQDGYFDNGFILHEQCNARHQNSFFVSTYTGDSKSNDVIVPTGEVRIPMHTIKLYGKNAQELADNLFDSIDKDLIVCTSVALWDPDKKQFDMAVQNLHK